VQVEKQQAGESPAIFYTGGNMNSNENFENCLNIILQHEGGYVNHPNDPGGMTNLGITKRVFEDWIGEEVDEEEMRNLTINDVAPIYRIQYWDKMRCSDLPHGLDLCVFDFGVNAGVSRASRYLQSIISTSPDGVIGPLTLHVTKEYVNENGIEQLIKKYQEHRLLYYHRLEHFETFGRGWTRRTDETTELALKMI
jgi:lysozyme family protein